MMRAFNVPGLAPAFSHKTSLIFFIGMIKPMISEIRKLMQKLFTKPGTVNIPELRLPISDKTKLIVIPISKLILTAGFFIIFFLGQINYIEFRYNQIRKKG